MLRPSVEIAGETSKFPRRLVEYTYTRAEVAVTITTMSSEARIVEMPRLFFRENSTKALTPLSQTSHSNAWSAETCIVTEYMAGQ